MGLEDLTQYEIIQGYASIIAMTIAIIIVLKIISKYFVYKKIEFLTVGLMVFFSTSGWWGSTFSFIMYVLFNYEISDVLYIFLSYGITTLSTLFWLYTFSSVVYPKSRWKITGAWIIISILYTTFFMYFLFTNPSLLAVRISRFDFESRTFVSMLILSSLFINLITQSIFLRKSIKSEDKIIIWKGRFIFLAFLLFLVAGIVDSVVQLNPITLIFTRALLILCAFVSYIGWTMPKRIQEWLIK